MTIEELTKQLATSQAQVQQLNSQLAKMGVGAAQPTQNPYSVATDAARGAKSAADTADAMMPRGPALGSSPMPGADSVLVPSGVEMSPEEQRRQQIYSGLANIDVAGQMLRAGRPSKRPITSSKMPHDPYDDYVAAQMQGVVARELGGIGGLQSSLPNSPQAINLPQERGTSGGQLIPLGTDRAEAAFNDYLKSSPADQAKLDRRAGMAGLDPRSFLSLSSLDQYKAINGQLNPSPNPTPLPAGPGDSGTLIPLSNRPAVTGNMPTNSIPNAQSTSFDSGVRTVISPNAPAFGAPFNGTGSFVRGSSAPINSSRKSSEIARDLNYRSNLAGAALDSLRRPAMRFGF